MSQKLYSIIFWFLLSLLVSAEPDWPCFSEELQFRPVIKRERSMDVAAGFFSRPDPIPVTRPTALKHWEVF